MAGQIPQRFLDDLMARVDVVEVVGERVKLKKAGRNYSGLCPFHQEKTPSFTVSADKQFYHCFGCGAHGNALGFLMEYDKLRFPEAVEQLAGRLGLEVLREGADDPRAQARERKRKEGVNLLELAASFFRERLKMPEGEGARQYLERRGLSPDVQQIFGIGYAPDDWEALKRHLTERGISDAVQVEYGLLVHREESGRTYDRFRDRVMFPIRDVKGRTIAFGGRVLGDAKPKYLNSPETPVFHKGRELYGLYEARQADHRLERVVIVEGYTDVVALAQFGIRNAVATLGTSTSEEHLTRLFRMVSEVVFCFDGDRAGRQAATRALETVLPLMIDGRQVRFLFLPEGEDPDSLVRAEGAEAFTARLKSALPLSEYLHDELASRVDMDSLDGRARLAELAKPLVAKVPEGVFRSLLVGRIARAVDMPEAAYGRFVEQAAPATPRAAPPRPRPQGHTAGRSSLVRRAVSLAVHFPARAATVPVPPGLASLDRPGMSLLLELLGQLDERMTTGSLLERWRDHEAGPHLQKLATAELITPEELAATELQDCLERLEEERVRLRHAELFEYSREGPLSPEQRAELKTLDARMARRPPASEPRRT